MRKELKDIKNSKPNSIPTLSLEKVHNQSRPYSVTNTIPQDEKVRATSSGIIHKSLKSENYISSIQNESGRQTDRLKLVLKEKEAINEALENEIIRKNEVIKNLHHTLESSQDKEFTNNQDLNEALEKQRSHFQDQFNQLNDQYELKCIEYRKLVDEVNSKEKEIYENISDHNSKNYDIARLKEDNNRLSRETMILRDEANKYKLRLNQAYKEIDSYKSSLDSYANQCDKLKHLNNELNRTLGDERSLNLRARNRVQEQVMKMSNRVDELEGYSMNIETNRDRSQRHEITPRTDILPGTVRSNASGVIIQSNMAKHPIDLVMDELKSENENLKAQIRNYQHQINRIQGEKQQMYQSLNQLKSSNLGVSIDTQNFRTPFKTPMTQPQTSSIKQNHNYNSSSEKEKSEAIIDYLRAEISHLREKYNKLDVDFANYKTQSKAQHTRTLNIHEFMKELMRPAKDLIYQLCSDPHMSESYFYKEDDKYHGLEGKYCLDICKLFKVATERIVELRTIMTK